MKSNQHSVPSFFDNLFGIEAIDKFVAKEFGFRDLSILVVYAAQWPQLYLS